ncbi:hypothetical protein EGR_10997 [Echinococcus granulosus]|uniref:Uncharacterized protein n=1 Tax=Echinococcus granulosus TaxID=6210 RepID=W6U6Z9_ECHGR|nr:hypothetical protein EGR_10997 [Echinococcus granulosus]EUB54142.1 hypothetical protein EGR_10997 [Echinococcus granulosus]
MSLHSHLNTLLLSSFAEESFLSNYVAHSQLVDSNSTSTSLPKFQNCPLVELILVSHLRGLEKTVNLLLLNAFIASEYFPAPHHYQPSGDSRQCLQNETVFCLLEMASVYISRIKGLMINYLPVSVVDIKSFGHVTKGRRNMGCPSGVLEKWKYC